MEIYDCGCQVRVYQVDHGEWEGDLPERPVTVPELTACAKHSGNGHEIPPRGSRLVTVLHEHEGFLNE